MWPKISMSQVWVWSMDKGFCRDQQRRTEIIKSNIPINRDKSAGLIRLRAFFWIASVELELQQSFLRFPPFTIKKTAKPLVYTNVPIRAYTLGVLRAVLVALTNVYDGKKDIRMYAHFFWHVEYIHIYRSRADLYIRNFSASTGLSLAKQGLQKVFLDCH